MKKILKIIFDKGSDETWAETFEYWYRWPITPDWLYKIYRRVTHAWYLSRVWKWIKWNREPDYQAISWDYFSHIIDTLPKTIEIIRDNCDVTFHEWLDEWLTKMTELCNEFNKLNNEFDEDIIAHNNKKVKVWIELCETLGKRWLYLRR